MNNTTVTAAAKAICLDCLHEIDRLRALLWKQHEEINTKDREISDFVEHLTEIRRLVEMEAPQHIVLQELQQALP